jgi:pyruvate/2-oxoglutarate dehydrogenase complex dihydrolipoamide acyltransferase (E2) component
MDDKQIVNLACEHLGARPAQVMSATVYPEHVSLVIDLGVKGCPKYHIKLDALEKQAPQPQPAIIDATGAALDLMQENEVNPYAVTGTGKDGRILLSDVRDYLEGLDNGDN